MIASGPHSDKSLEEIILASAGDDDQKKLFNNAAQVWNHTFFWHCMSPKGGGAPKGELAERIMRDFGSLDDFKKKFADIAGAQFGSGWAWLVDEDRKSHGQGKSCVSPCRSRWSPCHEKKNKQ